MMTCPCCTTCAEGDRCCQCTRHFGTYPRFVNIRVWGTMTYNPDAIPAGFPFSRACPCTSVYNFDDSITLSKNTADSRECYSWLFDGINVSRGTEEYCEGWSSPQTRVTLALWDSGTFADTGRLSVNIVHPCQSTCYCNGGRSNISANFYWAFTNCPDAESLLTQSRSLGGTGYQLVGTSTCNVQVTGFQA